MRMYPSKEELTITPQFLSPGFYLVWFPNHSISFFLWPYIWQILPNTFSKSVSFSTINIFHEILLSLKNKLFDGGKIFQGIVTYYSTKAAMFQDGALRCLNKFSSPLQTCHLPSKEGGGYNKAC